MPAFENAISVRPQSATTSRRALSLKWERAFDVLVTRECFDRPERAPDRAWTAHVGCVLASGRTILASLPSDYVHATEYSEEMFDASGEAVDYELESSVWACDAERSIFSYVDHWQAGLTGAVTVYAREEDYRRALDAAVRAAAMVSGKGASE